MLAGCLVDSTKKEASPDTTGLAPIVTVTPVNRGTHGMAERVLWTFSPDKKAVLVVADPGGVENEPVPNGFFFGDEARGFQTQMDSVWDVVPSPDWKWLGFGRAYSVVGGAGTGTDLLTDVSRRTSIDTATLRAGSFASSGMSMSRAVAQAGVVHIPNDPRQLAAGDSAAPKLFPVARGWRVRWTTDGTTLALGNSPARATDNEPSQTWAALDPTTGALHGTLPNQREARRCEDDGRSDDGPVAADRHDSFTADRDPARESNFLDSERARRDHHRGDDARLGDQSRAARCWGGSCFGRDRRRAVHHCAGAAQYARFKREFG